MPCPTNETHIKYALCEMSDDEDYEYEQHILSCDALICAQTRRDYLEEGDWQVQFRFQVPEDIIARVRQHDSSNAQRDVPV